ncbi:MAG: ABC transporter ATP-binding protein [Armatimonadetes bacterium]|nr:ABC transporter ATP-binding protein [Armatimonadota bacterium]
MNLLEARTLSKAYGPVQALDDVSVTFERGQIHAVLGENGAGKSTLMGVLSGFVTPDSGEVLTDGKPLRLGDPSACLAAGIEIVHQHFMLVPEFTVAENLALHTRPQLLSVFDPAQRVAKACEWAKQLGWPLDLEAKVRSLPVGARQRLEVLKALITECDFLILDEPTAVLSPQEVEDLFSALRILRDGGKGIILIAHKLREILAVAERATVMRRGKKVAETSIADTNEEQLVEWMVGEAVAPSMVGEWTTNEESVLKVSNLQVAGDRGENSVNGLSFEVRRGEILGFGGVDGNGQLELAEAVVGIRKARGGEVSRPATDEIAYVPQDRRHAGLALSMSIEENFMVAGQFRRELWSLGLIRWGKAREWINGLVQRFEIKVGSLRLPVSSLSGGNQQKIVVSRSLNSNTRLLVACNPTRGLDVKASMNVWQSILQAAEGGAAVVLITADLDELAALSHRKFFLNRGRLAATIEESVV